MTIITKFKLGQRVTWFSPDQGKQLKGTGVNDSGVGMAGINMLIKEMEP